MQCLGGADLCAFVAEDTFRPAFPLAGFFVDLHVHGADLQTLPAMDTLILITVDAQKRKIAHRFEKNRNGTQVLAEERIAHSHLIDNKRRQQHHHDEQHGVFQISQRLQTLGGALGRWDLMQKLLQPAKRAEKAADKASQQHPQ